MFDSEPTGPRVLVIDDSEDFLRILSHWLKSRGYRVMTAIDCRAGMKIIESVPLDIVFLDLRMPGVDGIETLRQIRKVRSDLSVILVTAFPQDPRIQDVQALGITGIFPKNENLDKLQGMIDAALRK